MVRVTILLLVAIAYIGMINSMVNANCSPNEEYKTCASYCEPTCANKNPICIQECKSAGCQCRGEFVRNNAGECVPANSC